MIQKSDLPDLVVEALRSMGGGANHVFVAKYIWDNYESEIRESGSLLYTWQYDLRWAAQKLRNSGNYKSDSETPKGVWELS